MSMTAILDISLVVVGLVALCVGYLVSSIWLARRAGAKLVTTLGVAALASLLLGVLWAFIAPDNIGTCGAPVSAPAVAFAMFEGVAAIAAVGSMWFSTAACWQHWQLLGSLFLIVFVDLVIVSLSVVGIALAATGGVCIF